LQMPVHPGVDVLELVAARAQVLQGRAGHPGAAVDQVHAGLVQGHRVPGGQDADVPHDGQVVVAVAVAGRGHLGDEADEHGPVPVELHHPGGVFHHLLQEDRDGFVPLDLDVAVGAHQQAFGAAHALGGVDDRLFRLRVDPDGLLGAVDHALLAAGALLLRNLGGDVGVLGELALAGGAAHAQVLQGAAEAGEFVELEVAKRHQGFRLQNSFRQVNRLKLLLINLHRYFGLAGEAVGDDQGGPHHRVGEAVFDGGGEMAHRLGPGAHVHGIGVGEKGPGAVVPQAVHHLAHVQRPDEGGVALLPEVELHGHQGPLLLALDDALQVNRLQELLKFLEIGLLGGGPEVHEKDLAGHGVTLFRGI